MTTYIIRRILLMIPTLLGITALVFFIMQSAPGDAAEMLLSNEGNMSPGDKAAAMAYIEKRYGLGDPVIVQYVRWLNRVSPVGFLNSEQINYSETVEEEMRQRIADAKLFDRSRESREKATFAIAKTLAQYRGKDPLETTDRVLEALANNPLDAAALLYEADFKEVAIDEAIDEDAEPEDRARQLAFIEVNRAIPESMVKARELMVEQMQLDLAGTNRVLFSRPAIKMPDLGHSFISNRPVSAMIGDALPITLLLNLITIPIIYFVAVVSGIYAARHHGGGFDIGSGTVLLGLWAVPIIWAGVLLKGFLANVDYAYWFPTSGLHATESDLMPFMPRLTEAGFERGWLLDSIWHLILPVICLSYGGFAFLSKLCRGSVLENIRADYVRTARAKGVGDHDVLWHHAFRNSLLPLITVAAHILPGLLAGSVIVEIIFTIPGMGRMMIQAIEFKDMEVVMAVTLISGVLTIVSYLIADLLYAVADPRVSYE